MTPGSTIEDSGAELLEWSPLMPCDHVEELNPRVALTSHLFCIMILLLSLCYARDTLITSDLSISLT